MIPRPPDMGSFEFAVIASLRAGQLIRGCMPRVPVAHTTAATAQLEVATGKVSAAVGAGPLPHHDA